MCVLRLFDGELKIFYKLRAASLVSSRSETHVVHGWKDLGQSTNPLSDFKHEKNQRSEWICPRSQSFISKTKRGI